MFGRIWDHVVNAFSNLNSVRKNGAQDWEQHRRGTFLHAEELERRNMLSATLITYDSSTSTVYIKGTTGNDSAKVWTDTSNVVHVSLTTPTDTQTATFARANVQLLSFAGDLGDDRFENDTDINSFASGDAGNDVLIGGTGLNYLIGGTGDDQLYGNIGIDQLYGQDGNDLLLGGDANDKLDGGAGDDTLYGGTGDDTLVAGDGNDYLSGDDGNDWMDGGNGTDQMLGGLGDDTLQGEAGDDQLSGGDGNDTLYGQAGNNVLSGDAGNDTLFGDVGTDTIHGGAGDDSLIGGDGNDTLYGDDGNDWLAGGNGDDFLNGGAGNDKLEGGSGDDALYGGNGDDTLIGQEGNDLLSGNTGNDWIDGGAGNDQLYGGTGDDTLQGDAGDDQLSGSDGNDKLSGGEDNDILFGEAGNDTLYGGAGDDTLHGSAGDDALVGGDGNDQLYGDDGNDWLSGQNGDDLLYGGDGNDKLDGGAGDDTLYGGTGDDTLVAGDGNDYLSGDDGNDWMDGGNGTDQMLGGLGDDTLQGEAGDDQLSGGDGNDTLYGQAGNNVLSGGAGNDTLYGDQGNDVIFGDAGDDSIIGDAGKDILYGGDGNDYIYGSTNASVLLGGAGNDQLIGGNENDVMIGGLGVDTLIGNGGDDLLIGGSTQYDTDLTTLSDISATWSVNASYAARVQVLSSMLFSANVSSGDDPSVHTTAAGGNVIDDQVADTLSGGDGQDWFFETGYMPMYLPSDVQSAQQANINSLVRCGTQIMYLSNQTPQLEGFNLYDSLDTFTDRQSNETLTSFVPEATSLSLEKEHLTLMQLVRYDQVNAYAIKSGNWLDPTIWHGGVVPAAGSHVLIPIGVDVQVDGMIPARIGTLRVDGTLSFSTTQNSQLQADTLVVSDCGTFQMGTAATPIPQNVTAKLLITDNGAIDRTWDPFGISRGLIAQGSVSIYGAQVDSYESIASGAMAGSQALTLKAVPIGWKAGDSLVVAATTAGVTQNETRLIKSISGNVVTLDSPLLYNHLSPSNLDVQVANTTRNAVIQSEGTAIVERGHVMFMHNRDVNIQYAGFYGLGRTDKSQPINDPVVLSNWTLKPGTGTNPRGRYAVHFHRDGVADDGNPAVIIGSAVVDSPGWGFVNHDSNVNMIDNVAYKVNGAAFTTEAGDEIGEFVNNMAIGSTGTNEEPDAREVGFQDFGFNGDGFWFQGAGVKVTGNIAAGNQGDGFAYYTRGLWQGATQTQFQTANLVDPSIAQGASTISVGQVPIREFSNNVAYASGAGLRLRYHLQFATQGQQSVVQNSTFWNNTKGMILQYDWNTIFQNVMVTTAQQYQIGIDGGGQTNNNLTFNNLNVSGYFSGIEMPRQGNSAIVGGTFNNAGYDIVLFSAEINARNILISGVIGLPKVKAEYNINPIVGFSDSADYFFVNDNVVLNYGPFVNQRLYSMMQEPNAIPFPTSRADIPSKYVGLTNQQLWNLYGVTFGGVMAPPNAVPAANITGVIAPVV